MGCLGSSGGLILGMAILGCSTLVSSGSLGLGGGVTFGLTTSGFLGITGSTNRASFRLASMVCVAAMLMMATTHASNTLIVSDTAVDALLWCPASSTPHRKSTRLNSSHRCISDAV